MPELPDRPDLDQLRRQARELLRAAAGGEGHAVAGLRAASGRFTLLAAQLAVAREHGYRNWPALKAEADRRRSLAESAAAPPSPGGDEQGSPGAREDRWSFGGATAIETTAGVLLPEALVAGAGHAALDASLAPSGNGQPAAARTRGLPAPGRPFTRWARRRRTKAAVAAMRALARFEDVTVVDDRGARYVLRVEAMSGARGLSGEPAGPTSVRLDLDPVPGRGVGWLELRSEGGAATRLLPSARPALRVGQLTPVAASPAARKLTDQALWLIELRLTTDGEAAEDILSQPCSAALARLAEMQRSGELDPASELADQLRRLCAVLTGHHLADRLPSSWSGMLDTARRTDGPRLHLDIGAALPRIGGVAVQADSLFSWPGSWRLYLRATPTWWRYSEDGARKWSPVSVHAEDDRGGTYLTTFGGSTRYPARDELGHEEAASHEELALRFLPRLDPLARALKLTCRA
jgi:hypothetical protein